MAEYKKLALMPFIADIIESDESYSDESEDEKRKRKLQKIDLYFEYFPDTDQKLLPNVKVYF